MGRKRFLMEIARGCCLALLGKCWLAGSSGLGRLDAAFLKFMQLGNASPDSIMFRTFATSIWNRAYCWRSLAGRLDCLGLLGWSISWTTINRHHWCEALSWVFDSRGALRAKLVTFTYHVIFRTNFQIRSTVWLRNETLWVHTLTLTYEVEFCWLQGHEMYSKNVQQLQKTIHEESRSEENMSVGSFEGEIDRHKWIQNIKMT